MRHLIDPLCPEVLTTCENTPKDGVSGLRVDREEIYRLKPKEEKK